MSTPEDRPYSPLHSQEDIIRMLRMLLGLAHGSVGPSMQSENWSIDYQGGNWWTYPMGKPDTEVRAHDTLAQALRRTGDVKTAEILEWAAREVGDALTQGQPITHISVPEWPPTMPVLKDAMTQAHPTAIVQEVRVHVSKYEKLLKLWRKSNTAAHFDRHRPFPYARVTATGQSPHIIEAIILEQGEATCEADCQVREVWFYSEVQAKPKKSSRKKKVTP